MSEVSGRRTLKVARSNRSQARSGRLRRITGRLLKTVVVLLAAVGVLTLVRPSADVGHFRTAADREQYLAAYQEALATLPPPTRTLDLTTDFGVVRGYEWAPAGLGEDDPRIAVPVVLLPGRASGAPMWRENLPFLITRRRVVVLDALGDAGLSQQTVPITTMAEQAAWVDQAVAQVADGKAHILGHSFGGATAAHYAATHPERVASLTLLEPAFALAWPPVSTFFWASVMGLPLPQSWRDHATAQIAGEDGPIDLSDPVAAMIDRAAVGYSASLPTPSPLSAEQQARLTMPVYVAIADHNSLAGGERAAARARELPQATVKIWPDTTHSLPMQAAEPLGAELGAFWAAHDA